MNTRKPSYPDWMKKLMHPEPELAGLAEYDLTKVDQWTHDDQKNGVVVDNTIHKHLKKDNVITSCLNLQEGLKGIVVFRKLFVGKSVFLWGSVVQDSNDDRGVPFLIEFGHQGMVRWL